MEKLKEIRKARGMSQKELAEKIGVSLKTIYRWEKGERVPKANQLPKLAKVLGCSIEDLLEDGNPSLSPA